MSCDKNLFDIFQNLIKLNYFIDRTFNFFNYTNHFIE